MNPPEVDQRRRLLRVGTGATPFAAAAHWSANDARAQSFPSRPLRPVVPFPAGGPTDIVARFLAQLLSQSLAQTIVLDNRGGAGGSIGADSVAKSPPDGYTLLLGTVGTHAINPALHRKLPYDASKDFTPLGLVALATMAIVVNAATPYKSIGELVAAARAAPGRDIARSWTTSRGRALEVGSPYPQTRLNSLFESTKCRTSAVLPIPASPVISKRLSSRRCARRACSASIASADSRSYSESTNSHFLAAWPAGQSKFECG